MKNLVFVAVLTGLFSSLASAESFEGVSQFEAVRLKGEVRVTCNDGHRRETAFYFCEQTILEPGERAYFLGQQGDIDEVMLQSTWPEGRVVRKKMSYDGEQAMTRRRVNLWIATVFQRPLLTMGANKVEFAYKKDGATVDTGEMTVDVLSGGTRFCPRRSMYSRGMADCRHSFGICHEYFQRNYQQCN